MSLFHGGALIEAAKRYGIAEDQWIDLSTGISPYSWPVPELPSSVWRDLPDSGDPLHEQAAEYYGCNASNILAIPGSQFVIELLPILKKAGRIAVPKWGYTEHAYRWQQAGHTLCWYENTTELIQLAEAGTLAAAVVINPNNPTADIVDKAELLQLHKCMASQRGLLVVDEAFIDCHAEHSLSSEFATQSINSGLIVLRSVGKFFGLAGLRLGFVMTSEPMLSRLSEGLSPWAVSHPARWVGQQALADTKWQQQQRQRLQSESTFYFAMLTKLLPQFDWRRGDMFNTGFGDEAQCRTLHELLAKHGVYTRLIEPADKVVAQKPSEKAAVRIGLCELDRRESFLEKLTEISVKLQSKESKETKEARSTA